MIKIMDDILDEANNVMMLLYPLFEKLTKLKFSLRNTLKQTNMKHAQTKTD